MTAEPPQPPRKPGRQPTVAESLDAIAERSQARSRRSRTLLLFYASVVVALVLAGIVVVNRNPAQPAPPSPPAATPAAPAPAADPIADRAFAATLDRLQAESAASADAREHTRVHRSQLQQVIDAAGLELKIDRFECGPRLCAAWLIGGSDAYGRLNAALPTTPQAPLRGIAGAATPPDGTPSDQLRHPLLLSIGSDADAANTAPTAPR